MNKKKTLLMASALLLATGGMLTAQGSAETAKKEDKPVHITLWYDPSQTEVGPLPNDWVGYQIIKDKFNIELEANTLPSGLMDQNTKLQAAAAADELPDFMCIFSRDVWLRLANNGMLADVSGQIDRMPHRKELMFDDASLSYCTIDGKLYGLPTPSKISRNEGLVIRKDWLDKLGLEIPTTTDELMQVAKAFTTQDPDGNGVNDTYGFGAFIETYSYEEYPGRRFEPIMGAFGVEGTWNMHKDQFGLNIHKPEFFEFVKFVRQMMTEGVIDPNWMAYKKDDFRGAWKQGRFGIMREQNSALHSQNNYSPFDSNFPEGEWIVIEPPKGTGGKRSVGPVVSAPRIYCASQKAADQGKLDKIADLFEWMSYGEGYMLCGFGREGIEYQMVDGIPVSIEGPNGFNGAVGQTYIQLRRMAFNYKSEAELLSRYPSWTSKNGRTISPLETLYAMQSKSWTDTMGQDSMPIPSTDLQTFYQQGLAEFFSGKRPLTQESWNQFIAQLDKIGAKDWEEAGYKVAKENGYLQ